MADLEGGVVAERGGGRSRVVHGQYGEVRSGIAPGEHGGQRAAVRHRDGDALLGPHGVVRGDDDARAPVDAGGRQPAAGVYGDDGGGGALHGLRQIVREREQPIHRDPPRAARSDFSMHEARAGGYPPNGQVRGLGPGGERRTHAGGGRAPPGPGEADDRHGDAGEARELGDAEARDPEAVQAQALDREAAHRVEADIPEDEGAGLVAIARPQPAHEGEEDGEVPEGLVQERRVEVLGIRVLGAAGAAARCRASTADRWAGRRLPR